MIMEYQKIISLSDNAPIQPSKFWTKNWVEINNDSTPSQALNCDGVVLEIYLDHNFQWPQEGLNCKSLAYEVVT